MIENAPREMQEANDKYKDLKHSNHSDLTTPDSFEHKEITETDFESSGVMCKELESREPVPTFVPQHEDLRNKEYAQNYQMLETLEQECVKIDGKNAITSPSVGSP